MWVLLFQTLLASLRALRRCDVGDRQRLEKPKRVLNVLRRFSSTAVIAMENMLHDRAEFRLRRSSSTRVERP